PSGRTGGVILQYVERHEEEFCVPARSYKYYEIWNVPANSKDTAWGLFYSKKENWAKYEEVIGKIVDNYGKGLGDTTKKAIIKYLGGNPDGVSPIWEDIYANLRPGKPGNGGTITIKSKAVYIDGSQKENYMKKTPGFRQEGGGPAGLLPML